MAHDPFCIMYYITKQPQNAAEHAPFRSKRERLVWRHARKGFTSHGERTSHGKTGAFGPFQHGAELGYCPADLPQRHGERRTAASYRYQARVRELEQRFEVELQGVRDAFLQELAGLDLEGQ